MIAVKFLMGLDFYSDTRMPPNIEQRKLLRKRSTDVRQINVEQLEIDRMEQPFGFFPLLDFDEKYYPDTMDLTKDTEAREYWLTCFEGKLSIQSNKLLQIFST